MTKKRFFILASLLSLALANNAQCQAPQPDTPAEEKPKIDEKTKADADRLHDNISMERALSRALELCRLSYYKPAKIEWTKVIDYMHSKGWFPTAAAVPVSLRFAQLSDCCLDENHIEDAHKLMHAAFEFPYQFEGKDIDPLLTKLIESDKKAGRIKQAKSLLECAIGQTEEARHALLKQLLESLG